MGSTFTIVLKKGTDYFIKDQLSDFIESYDDKDLLSRYVDKEKLVLFCLLYTSPSPRD